MSVILNPVEQYFDVDGSPLQSGYLYFGEVYGNPVTQPVMVYFDPEFTIPAAQPVRTINGYPVRSGTATGIYAPSDVSILVQNQNKEQVIYIQSSAIDAGDTTTIYRESDTTLNADDNNKTFILLNAFTQTFDPSVNLGNRWRVNIINFSSGNITLDPNLSETIDGQSTLQLQPNQVLTVYSDGVNLKTTTLIPPLVNVSSASNIDLRSVRPKVIKITGSSTINTVQMIQGDRYIAICSGIVTFTNSSSLIVQGGQNYTTRANDIVTFTKDETANNVYVNFNRYLVNATNDPTFASTSPSDIVSPEWALAGSAYSLATDGYVKLPKWLGGLIIQWGRINVPGTGSASVTFPIEFPVLCANVNVETTVASEVCYPSSVTKTGFTANQSGATSTNAFWFAMGY